MELERLSPGVEGGEDPDASAEMTVIGCDTQESLSRCPAEDVVDDDLVLVREARKLVRNREDDVEVLDGQKIFLAIGEPRLARVGLALRAVPVPAGVVRHSLVAAAVAAFEVAALGGGAARDDVAQDLSFCSRESTAPKSDEVVAVQADDVRNLERGTGHGRAQGQCSETRRSSGL